MLHELVVENYAVVERVRVRFHAGFNLLTGETGSGKSIVVGALGLLLGERASADVIRVGADRARVSGIFDAPSLPETLGIEVEEGELIIEREILANGKSRAFVNTRPVTIALLRELAPYVADIHGQHDQQALFEESTQRELLDSFGVDKLAETEAAFREWKQAQVELERLEQQEQERLRLADLWSFQKKEIQEAAPKAGEDTALEHEKRLLANVTKLSQSASEAYGALYESPESSIAALHAAVKRVDDLCRIDGSLSGTLQSMREAEIVLKDAAQVLRDYASSLEADPRRLEDVESRLATLDKLKRKYGPTLDEVIAFYDNVSTSLTGAETAEDRARTLRESTGKLAAAYEKVAGALREQRKAAAKKMERQVLSELKPLAMERTKFQVSLEPGDPSPQGSDKIEFLVSPNLGEDPRPMAKVLSGGELSRLALALKCVATNSAVRNRTLVFDEVDAGIGGAVAEAVGKRLKQVAASNQVLCVTHLAQIAAFGDHQFLVEKTEHKGRTLASIQELTREQRIRELGRMLAGDRLTPEVLKHAEQLISS